MVKLRLHGEIEEINQFVEFISTLSPQVRILSGSGNYKDRGASVYTRVYMDLELHTSEKNNRETEIAQRILKDVRQEITACREGVKWKD